jgi:hypothetical protein
VGSRYFEHKARRAWWATHLEAWRRSGVTRTEYCPLHRLNKSTLGRWLNALNLLESAREEARQRRKRTREPVSGNKRNKAIQAFWAMHVEVLNWSGVNAKDYAAAHHISVYSLRTCRARLDADPLQVDWRVRLHPSELGELPRCKCNVRAWSEHNGRCRPRIDRKLRQSNARRSPQGASLVPRGQRGGGLAARAASSRPALRTPGLTTRLPPDQGMHQRWFHVECACDYQCHEVHERSLRSRLNCIEQRGGCGVTRGHVCASPWGVGRVRGALREHVSDSRCARRVSGVGL